MIKLFLLLLQIMSATSYNIRPSKYVYSNYVEQWDCGEIPWEHENSEILCMEKEAYTSSIFPSKHYEIGRHVDTLKRIKSAKDALGKTVYNNMISMDNFLLEIQGINYPRADLDFAISLLTIVTFRNSIIYYGNAGPIEKRKKSTTYRLFFALFTFISVVFTKNVLSAT